VGGAGETRAGFAVEQAGIAANSIPTPWLTEPKDGPVPMSTEEERG
jgi:hypothetical protein